MNFEKLMSYFKLKNMISNEQCISRAPISGVGGEHEVISIVVKSDKYSFDYAQIIYRKKKGHMALVYADIMYKGFGGTRDHVTKINASVGDLKNTFIGYDSF